MPNAKKRIAHTPKIHIEPYVPKGNTTTNCPNYVATPIPALRQKTAKNFIENYQKITKICGIPIDIAPRKPKLEPIEKLEASPKKIANKSAQKTRSVITYAEYKKRREEEQQLTEELKITTVQKNTKKTRRGGNRAKLRKEKKHLREEMSTLSYKDSQQIYDKIREISNKLYNKETN